MTDFLKPLEEKMCALCLKDYMPTGRHQKYCVNCRAAGKAAWIAGRAKKRKWIKHTDVVGTCEICNESFRVRNGNQRYCQSTPCMEEVQRRQNQVSYDRRVKLLRAIGDGKVDDEKALIAMLEGELRALVKRCDAVKEAITALRKGAR